MCKNNWSAVRNEKIRDIIKVMRENGTKPKEIYKELAREYNLSASRIKCIEYGVAS